MTRSGLADDRGSALVTGVLSVALLMTLFLMVVQALLVMYVRSISASAAQDGALIASRRDASIASGVAATDALLATTSSGPLQSWSTSGSRSGDRVTITVQGQVVSIVGFGNVGVSVSRGVRVEQFRPQGATS